MPPHFSTKPSRENTLYSWNIQHRFIIIYDTPQSLCFPRRSVVVGVAGNVIRGEKKKKRKRCLRLGVGGFPENHTMTTRSIRRSVAGAAWAGSWSITMPKASFLVAVVTTQPPLTPGGKLPLELDGR